MSRLGDAPERQPGAFLALGTQGGCSCRGEAECSRQCCEFPACISSVLLPPRAAHGLGEPGRSCFVFQKHPEQPLRESEPRSVWAVNSRLNFCLIPNHLFTAEELPGLQVNCCTLSQSPCCLLSQQPHSTAQHCRNRFTAQQCQSQEYFLQVFIPVAFQDRPSKAQRGTQSATGQEIGHKPLRQPREKIPSCHPH